MRSPADSARLERAQRVTAFIALAVWLANASRPAMSRVDVAAEGALPRTLARWTTTNIDSGHVVLDTVPDATNSAWMAALRGAGVGVSWSGAIPATAIEAWPSATPGGAVTVVASSPRGTTHVVSDALGPLDSLRGGTASLRLASFEGDVTLTVDKQHARSASPAARGSRRVLVAGAANWESKFVVAALEESGWVVDVRLYLSPDKDVLQGSPGLLDTARYSAVVLMDSVGAQATSGVDRFVRQGGGVVLAGDASAAPRVASLIAWRLGKHETAPLGTLASDTLWRGLSRYPLSIDTARAVAVESRGIDVVRAARRVSSGRVAAVGYDATWRWRMAGRDSSHLMHRDWWSSVVAGVAYRGAASVATGAAPLATLHSTLGPPGAVMRPLPAALSPSVVANILGLIALGALLAEWWLRRARGQR